MNDDQPSVTVAELREALGRLLEAVEIRFGSAVSLGADHYWLLEPQAMFSLEGKPEVNAAQLSDDVATIRELLARPEDEIFLRHDLPMSPVCCNVWRASTFLLAANPQASFSNAGAREVALPLAAV